MALSDAYATAAEYRAAIGMTSTASDVAILVDLTTISRYLEGKLGRHFTKDAAAVARTYYPQVTSRMLRVDDIAAAPTFVKLDLDNDGVFEITLAPTDYELWPLNAALDPEPRPSTRIYLVSWGNYCEFMAGLKVQVTAQFGWPAIPSPVKTACIQIGAILRLESPRATRRIPELGDAIEASPDAMSLVRQLTDTYQMVRYV